MKLLIGTSTRQVGLGVDFLNHVAEVLTRVQAMPESYEIVFRGVRRTVVQRFPYSIFYQIEINQITVLAVFHSKRDPKIWQSRL